MYNLMHMGRLTHTDETGIILGSTSPLAVGSFVPVEAQERRLGASMGEDAHHYDLVRLLCLLYDRLYVPNTKYALGALVTAGLGPLMDELIHLYPDPFWITPDEPAATDIRKHVETDLRDRDLLKTVRKVDKNASNLYYFPKFESRAWLHDVNADLFVSGYLDFPLCVDEVIFPIFEYKSRAFQKEKAELAALEMLIDLEVPLFSELTIQEIRQIRADRNFVLFRQKLRELGQQVCYSRPDLKDINNLRQFLRDEVSRELWRIAEEREPDPLRIACKSIVSHVPLGGLEHILGSVFAIDDLAKELGFKSWVYVVLQMKKLTQKDKAAPRQ